MKIPLYRGLTERITLAGIPREITLLLATLSASCFFWFESLYIIVATLLLYLVLVWLYRVDSFFVEILIKHINQPDCFFS